MRIINKNIAILLAVVFLSACGKNAENTGEQAEAPENEPGVVRVSPESQKEIGLKTVTVKAGYISDAYECPGRIVQDTQNTYHISSPVSGHVESVSAAIGQRVTKNSVLAVVLAPGGNRAEVTANHDGMITAAYAAAGEKTDPMSFLFTVTELDPMWAVIDVPEKNLSMIEVGRAAEVTTPAYPQKDFGAAVVFLSPEIDGETRMVKARLSIKNPDNLLKFGMFINARIHQKSGKSGFYIPSEAVQTAQGESFVFVKSGGDTFQKKPVQPGREHGGMVEIADGLRNGDAVVVSGAFLLKSELLKSSIE
ncbi:MAG: efflux RND transporter periplasmic adaptor subunit [Elusimicrobiaceae bacterium]